MRIVYAPKARADLQTCVEYIAKDNPHVGRSTSCRPSVCARRPTRCGVLRWPRASPLQRTAGTKLAGSAGTSLLPAPDQRAESPSHLPPRTKANCPLSPIWHHLPRYPPFLGLLRQEIGRRFHASILDGDRFGRSLEAVTSLRPLLLWRKRTQAVSMTERGGGS